MKIRYKRSNKMANKLSPMVTQARIFAILASFGKGSPFNFAIAFAFLAITSAIMAGIKLKINRKKNKKRKKTATETIEKMREA